MTEQKLPQIDIQHMRQIIRPLDTLDDDFAISDDVSSLSYYTRPQRLEACVFALVLQGKVTFSMNLETFSVGENQLVVFLPQQIVQYHSQSPDFKALFIMLNQSFVETFLPNWQILPMYFHVLKHPFTSLSEQELKRLSDYHSLLWSHIKQTATPYRKEITQHLLQALYYEISSLFNLHHKESENSTRQEEILAQFLNIVGKNYKKERSVTFYANEMCVTPKYLSTVIKQVSGKTAGEWIADYVVFEAKALLKATGMSIQEIAYTLNFPNQSFFGKYFKEKVGMTPGQFRGK